MLSLSKSLLTVLNRLLPVLFLLAFPFTTPCQDNTGKLLRELNRTIEATSTYDAGKLNTIAQLKESFSGNTANDLLFNAYLRLYG